MNFTLDDTASQLVFSHNWAPQSPTDPNLSQFFSGTYHAAQSPGATLNMTVQGSVLYIYGSKGPTHADFTVQFDDAISPPLTANAPETQFQQVLFRADLDPSITNHFISMTAIPNGENVWLDVDFVTISSTNSTDTPVTAVPNTVPLPWPSSSTAIATSTSTSVGVAGDVGTTGHSEETKLNIATTVLAILFGITIAIGILLFTLSGLLRRRYDRKRAREHSFRMGAPGGTKLVIGAPTHLEHTDSGGITSSAYRDPALATSQNHLLSLPLNTSSAALSVERSTLSLAHTHIREKDGGGILPSPPHSPGFGSLASSLTMSMASSSSALTKGSDSNSQKALLTIPAAADATTTYARTSPKPFGFLSQAPSAFQMGIPGMKRVSKGDADSMKTDFLQV